MRLSPIILETAVGSRKSVQALEAPSKIKKMLITNKVTTSFLIPLCAAISCMSFSRSTAVSRIILFVMIFAGFTACSKSEPKPEVEPVVKSEKLQGVIPPQQLKALEKAKEIEDVMKTRAEQLDENLKSSQ